MFERFTGGARAVVVNAQEEARRLGNGDVNTVHLLLAVLSNDAHRGAQLLAAAGVDLDRARTSTLEHAERGESAPEGHMPFSRSAKKVLELSLREALQLGHNRIGSEHILLALVREGSGATGAVFDELGVTLDPLRTLAIGWADEPVVPVRYEPMFGAPRKLISSGSPFEPVMGYSRAVRVFNQLAVAGTAPQWPDGHVDPDVAAQARRVFEIIGGALREAGFGFEHVVRTRVFLVDAQDFDAVAAVHGEIFGEVRPANTTVIVAGLLNPAWKLEVEVDAVLS